MGSDPMRDSFLALRDSCQDSGRDWFPIRFFSARDNSNRHIKLGLGTFAAPAYSPDLALSDFHLFRSMQHALADSQFKTVNDIRNFVDEFIAPKPPHIFRDGIRMLPDRWRKIIENSGQYFED